MATQQSRSCNLALDEAEGAELAGAGEHRVALAEMLQELQANQAGLKRLQDPYGVFVFTGGALPSGPFELLAVNSYLARPFATDRISTGEVQRYPASHGDRDGTAGRHSSRTEEPA